MNLSTRLGGITTAGFVHMVCVACRTGGLEGPAQYASARANCENEREAPSQQSLVLLLC